MREQSALLPKQMLHVPGNREPWSFSSGRAVAHGARRQMPYLPLGPWGQPQSHPSFEAQFMETELAPILGLFDLNTVKFGPKLVPAHCRALLNGVDENCKLIFAHRFESLREARAAFDHILALAETLADRDLFPDGLSRSLSLDMGLIFPLHAVAWKCRYPDLRRRGLAVLQRIPKREWMFDAERYHAVFEADDRDRAGLNGRRRGRGCW